MDGQTLDPRVCYEAICSRDVRFDGRFVVAVLTTGVYCRPSCPSRTPRAENVRFFPTPEAAKHAGFRACRRCRPDLLTDFAQVADLPLASQALHEIAHPGDDADTGADRLAYRDLPFTDVGSLADRLGLSARHLQRLLGTQVGLRPHALIRFVRLHAAVELLRSSDLSLTQVAIAAGFSSLRALEQATTGAFSLSPSALRATLRCGSTTTPDPAFGPAIDLLLSFRGPFDVHELLRFLALRAVPGLEEADTDGHWYRRVLNLSDGFGIAEIRAPGNPGATNIHLNLRLSSIQDLVEAVQACRRLLDLDANPDAIVSTLGADPLLGDEVRRHPGRRVPGHVDGAELAIRAVLGQQISIEAARTHTARLVSLYGTPLPHAVGSLRFAFPTPQQIAAVGVDLPGMSMPEARRRSIHGLAMAMHTGRVPPLRPGADGDRIGRALEGLFGIGPWTRAYIAMRALADPDAFPAKDLGVVHRLTELTGRSLTVREIEHLSDRWRPFRAYAVVHLWLQENEQRRPRASATLRSQRQSRGKSSVRPKGQHSPEPLRPSQEPGGDAP